MIVLEGPDGAGKTTLSKQLLAAGVVDNIVLSPRTVVKRKTELLYTESMRYIINYGPQHRTVIDRFLFSEMVYGPILRDKTVFTTTEYLTLLGKLFESRSPIVFCLPSELDLKDDENTDGVHRSHDYLLERMPMIVDKYTATCDGILPIYRRAIRYNWQLPGAYPKLLQFLKG